MNAAGSALTYSTYLGGIGADGASSIALDAATNAYITGSTFSADFPTADPIQAIAGGASDALAAKLSATGSSLVYAIYLGGSGTDRGWGIAVDSSDNAYLAGTTLSTNFPTANPSQSTNAGLFDSFVAKIDPGPALPTPTPGPASTPTPPTVGGVGGIAELPAAAREPVQKVSGTFGPTAGLLAVIVAITASSVVLGCAAWYAKRH